VNRFSGQRPFPQACLHRLVVEEAGVAVEDGSDLQLLLAARADEIELALDLDQKRFGLFDELVGVHGLSFLVEVGIRAGL